MSRASGWSQPSRSISPTQWPEASRCPVICTPAQPVSAVPIATGFHPVISTSSALTSVKMTSRLIGCEEKDLDENLREGEPEEQIERRAVLVHFRPQHGSFPRVADELRQPFRRHPPEPRPRSLPLPHHRPTPL